MLDAAFKEGMFGGVAHIARPENQTPYGGSVEHMKQPPDVVAVGMG